MPYNDVSGVAPVYGAEVGGGATAFGAEKSGSAPAFGGCIGATIFPVLVSAAPPSVPAGTARSVTLTGLNFQGPASVNISGAGVVVSAVVVVNSTTITATFTVDIAAATTVRTVSVTCPQGISNTINFTISLPSQVIADIGNCEFLMDAIDGISIGAAPATGAHGWWRVQVTASGPSNFAPAIAELQFRATVGGANQAVGGVASASSIFNAGWVAANAFDGNAATSWSALNPGVAWVAYHFAAPVSVAQISMKARADANDMPISFDVQYSDDGAAWTTLWSVGGQTGWALGETRLFVPTGQLQVLDLSGRGRIVSVVGSPTLGPTLWGGTLPALQFTAGTGSRLQIPLPVIPQPLTYIAIIDNYLNVGNFNNLINDGGTVTYAQAGTWKMFAGLTFDTAITQAANLGKLFRASIFNGVTSKAIKGTAAPLIGNPGASGTGLQLNIGARFDGIDPCTAIVAAIVLFSKELSPAELTIAYNFYAARYPGLLP